MSGRAWAAYCGNGYLWFRLFGYGLQIVDRRRNPPLFSERVGLRRWLRVGPWSVRHLTPEAPCQPSGFTREDVAALEALYRMGCTCGVITAEDSRQWADAQTRVPGVIARIAALLPPETP